MDERVQVSQMSREAREALAQRIRSRLSPAEDEARDHDVGIVGGGVAALTLALEIRRARPTTHILVIEPKVESSAHESVRLRRTLRDLRIPVDVVVVDEDKARRRAKVKGTMVERALREGRDLVS